MTWPVGIDMELFANDLSFHKQFRDIAAFRGALSRLMAMRRAARRFEREVHCHRALLHASPMPDMSMQQAIAHLAVESERRAALAWLTRSGPFWDDLRQSDAGDWLECRGEIVTDTAVGEAGFRMLHGADCGLVSVMPSNWNDTPVEVIWRQETDGLDDRNTALQNWWDPETLEQGLRDKARPIRSWDELREASTNRFESLTFTETCFTPLKGIPFAKSAAERFLALLDALDRLKRAFDENGVRTAEGHQLYQNYFTGTEAPFSDSSTQEKRDFRQELTFIHPDDPGNTLFCPWHGKIRRMILRLHFSWPIESDKPTYVVYAGPKLTKQ